MIDRIVIRFNEVRHNVIAFMSFASGDRSGPGELESWYTLTAYILNILFFECLMYLLTMVSSVHAL